MHDDIDKALSRTAPVVVLGDINTAPSEPAFSAFTAGLRDAHAEVGVVPGRTYRPSRFESLGIGFIRIDVVLTGPGLRPISETTRCPPAGDHCAVLVTLASDGHSTQTPHPSGISCITPLAAAACQGTAGSERTRPRRLNADGRQT